MVFTVKGVVELQADRRQLQVVRHTHDLVRRAGKREAGPTRVSGEGKGKFRTKGRYASATVRGTWWLTADFCKYTLIRVTQGSVTAQNLNSKKYRVVKAPKSYTARPSKP